MTSREVGLQDIRQDELVRAAACARERAYAPYSGFKVGAAVLGASGSIYVGCNVENASYGLTLCAERVAIGSAIAAGETSISAVAVIANTREVVRPCGACLQVIAEFSRAEEPVSIIAAAGDGKTDVRSLTDYLPIQFRFSPGGGE